MRHLHPEPTARRAHGPGLVMIAAAALLLVLAGCRGRSIQEVGRCVDPCPPDACGIRWAEPVHDPACGGDPMVGADGTGAFTRR